MFDTVSKQPFYNQGTGEFKYMIKGEVPFVQPVKSGYGVDDNVTAGNVSVEITSHTRDSSSGPAWKAMVGPVTKDYNTDMWCVGPGNTPSTSTWQFGRPLRIEKIEFNNPWLVPNTYEIYGVNGSAKVLLAGGACDKGASVSLTITDSTYYEALSMSIKGNAAGNAGMQNLVITAYYKP